jgi:hypothetical protein
VSKTAPYLLSSPLRMFALGAALRNIRRGGLCCLVLEVVSQVRRISLLGTSVNEPWSSAAGLPQVFR